MTKFKLNIKINLFDLLPAQQGYDRAITVFSPDGRLYQVEYAIETVRRGTIAIGIKCKNGIIIAVEEKPRKLQIAHTSQKIFQIDDHIGVAAAGYIPDARNQVDSARFFAQSNRLIYNEPVDAEAVAKHLADQCQQFTQYAGVRPFGVALIIGGVVDDKCSLYLTDPSGTYIPYDAVAIGSGSEKVTEFFEKKYTSEITLDEASVLAISAIYITSEDKDNAKYIKMSKINLDSKIFENISDDKINMFSQKAKERYNSNK